jgi:hypothetical protein
MPLFTNREFATLFWLALFVLWAMTRHEVRSSMLGVIKAFLNIKVVVPLLLFAVYIAAWVYAAANVGLWERTLLKDTLIWFVLSGLPLFVQSAEAGKDERFFQRAVLTTIGISAFLEFFVNVTSFTLLAELIIVPVLALLTMALTLTKFWARTQQEYVPTERFLGALLSIVGIGLLFATAREVYLQRDNLDSDLLWRSFLLFFWLPLVALPFIYGLALVAGYEIAFMRMRFANDRQLPSFKSRLALIIGLNGHLREVDSFSGPWAVWVSKAPTFRRALDLVRDSRHRGRRIMPRSGRSDTDS